jgi:hypothetical protein
MFRRSAFLTLNLLLAGMAAAQNMPLVEEKSTRVSDHVYAIMGFPNIALIVGNRATLVVDTGLGPRNGETVMRVLKKLSTAQSSSSLPRTSMPSTPLEKRVSQPISSSSALPCNSRRWK